MKSIISITISLVTIFSLSTPETTKCQTITTPITDNKTMFQSVPGELIVKQNVNDADVIIIDARCVVHAKYSDSELVELEKNCKNASEWSDFYEEYLFYNDDVSMFLYERALVKTVYNQKYIRFLFASGKTITIDKKKSAGKLFFFNPLTDLKQCNASGFDRRKYTEF